MPHEIYKNKKVLITGHTGFKGSWLALWLTRLGADVAGYSLPPLELSHFNLLKLPIKNYFADINFEKNLEDAFFEFKPEIVFHLAAKPLVRESYDDPVLTYKTNVMGSLNVYQAALKNNVKAVVSITTDKVYENLETRKAFVESDRLGGHDPYSSSKACVEIMSDSYRKSFLSDHKMLLATARAGNVIGGGDWAIDRLIPDLVKNAHLKNPTPIRNKDATRPWQHVLEPLHGYLLLGEKLLLGQHDFATSFNFGPNPEGEASVIHVCELAKSHWNSIETKIIPEVASRKHEAHLLKLDINKAKSMLGWKPRLTCQEAVALTIHWYRNFYEKGSICSEKNLDHFLSFL